MKTVSQTLEFMSLYPNTVMGWGIGIGTALIGLSSLVVAIKVAV